MSVNKKINDAEKLPTKNENQLPEVKTFSVKLVKNSTKKMHVMQFNEAQKVEFADWKRARLQRENNFSLFVPDCHPQNQQSKFGGGTAFDRRAAREEARCCQLVRDYKPENQPWILTTNKADGDQRTNDKSFKGTRQGGIGENSEYYIFTLDSSGEHISAYPVQEWYKFHSTKRYKTLSSEEAQEEYMRREKMLNYFPVMMQRRLKRKIKNNEPVQNLNISEMDEWIISNEGDEDSDGNNRQSDNDKDKKKKNKGNLKKKKTTDNEAFEESDDGDQEGRECEYVTDSSASDTELELKREEGNKSVAEETGLMNLHRSDSESNDDENKENEKPEMTSGKVKSARGADSSIIFQGSDKENKTTSDNLLGVTEDKIKFHKRRQSVSSDKALAKRYKCESPSVFSYSSYMFGPR